MKNDTEINKNDKSNSNERLLNKILNTFKLGKDVFLRKNFCDSDTLFKLGLPYIQSPIENRNDDQKNFIILYLNQMEKFITLIKNPNVEEYNKTLDIVSENLNYEYFEKKGLIIKFGDIARNFYTLLSGKINILIPNKITAILNLNEYSRYIALLILYQEFEILKILLKENRLEFTLNLPEFKFIFHYYDKKNDVKDATKKGLVKVSSKKLLLKYSSKSLLEDNMNEEEKLEIKNNNTLKTFMKRYLTQDEYHKFTNKKNNGDNNKEIIEPEEYINRLKNYKIESITDANLIKRFTLLENSQSVHNKSRIPLTIYEYKLSESELKTGDIIGNDELNSTENKFQKTLIASIDCHLGSLNKKTYNIIRASSEKKKKDKINFLSRIKLFKTINIKDKDEKFLKLFKFNDCYLDEYIIKKGELNDNLILIKNGTFEINFNGKINDILDLINYFKESYKENFSDNDFKKFIFDRNLVIKICKLNNNREKIISLFNSQEKNQISNSNIHKLFVINNLSIFGLKETEQKEVDYKTEDEYYYSFFDIKCTSIEGEYALLSKNYFYKQIYGIDYKVKDETKSYMKEFVENTISRLINVLYCKIWNLLTKNEMQIYKFIKMSNIEEENKQKENNNLLLDFPVDFDYINKYNMTHIEFIIDKIFNKYHNNAFVVKKENSNLLSFKTNEINTKQKNKLKKEEEKYDKKKINSIVLDVNKNKQNRIQRLNKFKTIMEEGKLIILKHLKIDKILNLSQDSVKDNFNRTSYKIKNYNNMRNNSTYNQKANKINLIKKGILTPAITNIKLRRSISSYYKKNKGFKTLKIFNFKKSSFPKRNASFIITPNSSYIKMDFEKRMKKLNSTSTFKDVDSLQSSYVSFNNAQISKVNLSFVKKESFSNEQDRALKNYCKTNMRKLGISVRNSSAKNSNHSKNNYFDSIQHSQDFYIEKRNNYVLKNTRDYFTKYKNFVLHKIIKKMEDKSVQSI